jgi:outer membrane protein assembly factor BamB
MVQPKCLYLGVKGSVLALNPATGGQLWTTSLKGSDFVNIVLDGPNLYASTQGEIFCLDPGSGAVRWHNPLKGHGLGLVTIAGEAVPQNPAVLMEERFRRDREAATVSSATAI